MQIKTYNNFEVFNTYKPFFNEDLKILNAGGRLI